MALSSEEKGEGLVVECATDIRESAFRDPPDDPLSSSAWNPRKLATARSSCLAHVDDSPASTGITAPTLALGMLFSTTYWALEDMNLWTANFLHAGASKSWYSVAAAEAETFEKVLEESVRSWVPDGSYACADCNLVGYLAMWVTLLMWTRPKSLELCRHVPHRRMTHVDH